MSRLNKRALYQMATQTGNSAALNTDTQTFSSQNPTSRSGAELMVEELTMEMVELKPVPSQNLSQMPDGRLSGSFVHPLDLGLVANDAASVSLRARRSKDSLSTEGINRTAVLNRVGHSTLGYLTNSYLEQQTMTDEEMHTIQQRFYGLRAV